MINPVRKKTGSSLVDYKDDWSACLERIGAHKDKSAFSALFNHFAPLLKGFLTKSGGVTPEHAEELVQETMIKVWNKAPGFSASRASASTWIYTIARNTRIDFLRKESRRRPEDLTAEELYDEQDEPMPYTSLVHLRNRRNIRENLDQLPEEQRQTLTLMYFHGKSGQEVADELSIPLGTVKSRVRLALAKLKLGFGTGNAQGQEVYNG